MKYILTLFSVLILFSCDDPDPAPEEGSSTSYRQLMREMVIGISQKAKSANASFLIIPQNGIELVVENDEDQTPNAAYLAAIDGHGQEDFLYGYDNDNEATPADATSYLKTYLDLSRANGNTVLVTDYCQDQAKIENSYQVNNNYGYVSFAAPERELSVIPSAPPYNENDNVITALTNVKNFLYLINPDVFDSKQDFITAITATNYDAVIIDLFIGGEALTASDVAQLRQKANGGKRLVIAYMSIGEAENYRYYWNNSWNTNLPEWVAGENPDWTGNFKVKYWSEEWQGIIYKSSNSYLDKITTAGFDGVYLDIIDAFEYFEGA